MAVNAQRQLGMNNSSVGKALEKLFLRLPHQPCRRRCVRSGDLEKMKAQIKGLDNGFLNAQDGVSVVQTAGRCAD